MDTSKLTPNTDSYRENKDKSSEPEKEERHVNKVANGVAKKNPIRNLAGMLFADDLHSIGENLIEEVVIRNLRQFISNTIDSAIDVTFYGGHGRPYTNDRNTSQKYSRQYDSRDRDRRIDRQTSVRKKYDYMDVRVNTRREAEMVIMTLEDAISRYGIVSVADLYDACGLNTVYTDRNYGWTDVSQAEVVPVRDGYLIKLPKALPLD